MKENDGCPVVDHEEIIIQDGCSPLSEPNDLLVQSQGPIKSIQPQKIDKLSRKELVCQEYTNDAVFDYNQEQYKQLNNFHNSSVNSNQSNMLGSPANRHAQKTHNHS